MLVRITNLSGTSKHFSLGICEEEKEKGKKGKEKEKDEVKETENEEKEDGNKIGR